MSAPTIKAIETVYAGRRFRSRLEARWAVFFDALDIRWQYEAEGYVIDGEPYLPDFYLPDLGYTIEIKPVTYDWYAPSKEHGAFAAIDNFFLIAGEPGRIDDGQAMNPEGGPYICYIRGDYGYYWCECRECGSIGLCFEGRANRLPCKGIYVYGTTGRVKPDTGCEVYGHPDKDRRTDTPRLQQAYTAALSARFEHGENGRRK